MSYEGYTQCICQNGHYFERDCFTTWGGCPQCNTAPAWNNEVDQTNGPDQGRIPIKMLMEKFLQQSGIQQRCNLGHLHQVTPDIYRIPDKCETDPLRTFEDEDLDF